MDFSTPVHPSSFGSSGRRCVYGSTTLPVHSTPTFHRGPETLYLQTGASLQNPSLSRDLTHSSHRSAPSSQFPTETSVTVHHTCGSRRFSPTSDRTYDRGCSGRVTLLNCKGPCAIHNSFVIKVKIGTKGDSHGYPSR